ncbi:hypothetical protein AC579_8877 [Pseudocercospora musae]|uniref:Uncharacterized protein n=1 Tax=Pseudocercospora musae TaxID=113226 RepID=A0A139I4W2_9PEZI|nr:hypothetical protein AC579_8877 [Pseudocercospora musae]
MASQPLPPSRTMSVGPPSAGGLNAQATTTPGGGQQNSQQNLNQITDASPGFSQSLGAQAGLK